MRFPSLQSLAADTGRTFLRFPIAIILAAKAVVLGIRWTHLATSFGEDLPPGWYWDAIVSCYLGMLLSIAATLWTEKNRYPEDRRRRRKWAIGLQVAVLALTALYYWSLPPQMSEADVLRTVVLALGLHWLIAVVGFGGDEVNGFWQFNKRLFLRALATGLYTAVLYMGISLALLAVDKLFNVDVKYRIYEDLWWLIGGLFSVWFFLAGFPRTYENPAEITDYPKGLKVFTQYVLLTLVTLYMLILYAYMIKIILTRHWPAGWVAWMITAFAVAGILSLLLIYPLRDRPENAWARGYWKLFYNAQLPLIIMLLVAVEKRILPYGYTEQRYLLLVLTIWLFGMTIYFLVSRRKDIRIVPRSLCVAAFLCCWGPWGAFSVSVRSQMHRLTDLLGKNGMFSAGKASAAKEGATISLQDRIAISSVVDYLVKQHGYKTLQPLFGRNLDSLMHSNSLTGRWSESGQEQAVMKLLNVEYASRWMNYEVTSPETVTVQHPFSCEPESSDSAIVTDGAIYFGTFGVGPGEADRDFITVGQDKLRITEDSARSELWLAWVSGGPEARIDLAPVAERITASVFQYAVSLPGRELEIPFSGPAISGKVVLSSLEGSQTDKRVRFARIRGTILFSKK